MIITHNLIKYTAVKTHKNILDTYTKFSDEHPYVSSITEAAVVHGAMIATQAVGRRAGVSIGHGHRENPRRNELIQEHPVAAATGSLVWAPVSEEVVFRKIVPNALSRRLNYEPGSRQDRTAKLAIAGLFAAAHAGPDAIPIPQFVSGIHYQKVHDSRGIGSAIAAHATSNTLAAARYVSKMRRSQTQNKRE
jgi:membrane protease YdiL (CAAX protease family)